MGENPYMPPNERETQNGSTMLRWSGIVLLGLGLILSARMAWLFAMYPHLRQSRFPGDDLTLRLSIILAAGIVMMAAGLAMVWHSRRKRPDA